MPLARISVDLARKSNDNPFNRWPTRDSGPNRLDPLCKPSFAPGFRLNSGDKVFTIGSCFARNVERALHARGFDLPAWRVLEADPEFKSFGPEILNNYAAPSIYNEVSWALDPSRPFVPEQNFEEAFPGKFIDMHLPRVIKPAAWETTIARRNAIKQMYREIADCPLIIITLGLTECWYDCETALYLNTRPHRSSILKSPERFELHVLDYADTIHYLALTFELIRDARRADAHVLLTVSPVPIAKTYRDMDVITANTYSKAVLRAVAEEIVSKFDFVEYFPSYESVTLSRRDLAWVDDNVHVQRDLIDLNVERMMAAYTGAVDADRPSSAKEEAIDQTTLDAIREHSITEPGTICKFVEASPHLLHSDAAVAAAYCSACIALGKCNEAADALNAIPEDWQPADRALLGARLHYAKNEFNDATNILRALVQGRQPQRTAREAWLLLLRAALAAGGASAGGEILDEWSAGSTMMTAEAFRLVAAAWAKAGDAAHAERSFQAGLNYSGAHGKLMIDYVHFLLEQGRSDEARSYVDLIDASRPARRRQRDDLLRRLNGPRETMA